MKTTVMKFGGTSVDRMDLVGDIVESEVARDGKAVAVVSAFSGETNKLLEISKEVLARFGHYIAHNESFYKLFDDLIDGTLKRVGRFLDEEKVPADRKQEILEEIREYLSEQVADVEKKFGWADTIMRLRDQREFAKYVEDRIVGLGEIFSAHVLAKMFTVRSNVGRVYRDVNLHNVFEAMDPPDIFRGEDPDQIEPEKLYTALSASIAEKVGRALAEGEVPIVTGYAGYIPGGILETIDRGYTDSTAALTARGIKRSQGNEHRVTLEIWKEVDGLLSADPKIVGKQAVLRPRAHFDEAAELSDLAGMKAINPHGIWVLDGENVDIHVKNTFNRQAPGTVISLNDDAEVTGVRFISGKKKQTVFRVSSSKMIEQKGVAADIFTICKKEGISVDAITTSARTVVFSVDEKDALNGKLSSLLEHYGRVEKKDGMAIVCCIGNDMADRKGLLSWLSGILAGHGINIEFDGGDGDRNITFIVKEEDYEKAIRALHQWSFYPDIRGAVRGAVGIVRSILGSNVPAND